MVADWVDDSADSPTVLLVNRVDLDCARAYRLCYERIRIGYGWDHSNGATAKRLGPEVSHAPEILR